MAGETIAGRYRLLEPLGRGAMSSVWLAHDDELERQVAVKMLGPTADRARFEREARAVAALSHPNIAALYDYGEAEGRPFMVLECLTGGSLEERLTGGAPLPDAETLRIATEIAAGLAHAHDRGLVHRDLKPANILFDSEGRAKIADFGIARMGDEGTLTEAGTVLGTASYISPEQAAGRPAGPPSDVYSFGVILFRMLTGRLPFVSTNAMELVRMHRDDPPPTVHEIRPDAPARLESIATAALAKDPAERLPDGAALFAELRGDEPTAATTAATAVIRRPQRRTRPLLIPLAALAIVLLGGGIALAVLATRGGSPAPSAPTTGLTLPRVSTAGSTSTTAPTTTVAPAPTTTHARSTTTAPTTSTHAATTTAPVATTLPTLPTTTTVPPTTTFVPPPVTTTTATTATTTAATTTDTTPTTTTTTTTTHPSVKALYFGTYDRSHPRNVNAIAAMRAAGVDVVERQAPVKGRGLGGALSVFSAETKLLAPRPGEFDVVIVGYPGHFDVPRARRVARGKPLVFDAVLSLEDELVAVRQRFRDRSAAATVLRAVDFRALRLPDLVVCGTTAEARYLAQLGAKRTEAVFLGADEDVFCETWSPTYPFSALHVADGSPGVVHDASRRTGTPITIAERGEIEWDARGIAVAHAGIVLGSFRQSRAIPPIVFEALATGVPVITADTDAARELLTDGDSALLVPPEDSGALAGAVDRLAGDEELRARIAARGHDVYRERASRVVLGARWRTLLGETLRQ